ncbi:hypothetical protein BX285_3697 [Streptomyces sp. 1114.5]|uniref:hypothetical protein n=1 Tax=unclassified Streptomyces TaxID=2593676 RepID=UPI000BD990EC|nr:MULTISPECIES: hypothetical protein [unclassified Streptomyces]RKT19241.1 hypothetical protein BX285_3697 [Streptomyces sp. 1114.5]SOB85438.1 hypothetical protein SAMN06272789_5726 [Streptomyces sp. 1331.2]
MTTSTHATRALRAAVFTALAVPMAALGQVVITGRPLPLSLVASACVVVFLVAAAMAGGERRMLHISGVMVPVELLLNTTFNLGQTSCGPMLTGQVPARGVNLLVCGGGSMDGSLLSGSLGHAGQLAPVATQLLLLLVHLVIALAAAGWLRLGDAALSGLARALRALQKSLARPLRALLVLLLPAPVRPVLRVPLPVSDRVRPRREDVVLSPAPRRGPPAFAPAC